MACLPHRSCRPASRKKAVSCLLALQYLLLPTFDICQLVLNSHSQDDLSSFVCFALIISGCKAGSMVRVDRLDRFQVHDSTLDERTGIWIALCELLLSFCTPFLGISTVFAGNSMERDCIRIAVQARVKDGDGAQSPTERQRS